MNSPHCKVAPAATFACSPPIVKVHPLIIRLVIIIIIIIIIIGIIIIMSILSPIIITIIIIVIIIIIIIIIISGSSRSSSSSSSSSSSIMIISLVAMEHWAWRHTCTSIELKRWSFLQNNFWLLKEPISFYLFWKEKQWSVSQECFCGYCLR